MAIETGAAIDVFGTPDKVTGSSSAVSNGSFSVQADIVTWPNDDDVREASVTLETAFGGTPDAFATVQLFARPLNVQGTSDNTTPDANYQHVDLGFFPINNSSANQLTTIDVILPNFKTSSEYEFYVWNNTGQTMSAGWDLYVTPKTLAPHA